MRRRKAHEKAVEEARLVEIERKKERYVGLLSHWTFQVCAIVGEWMDWDQRLCMDRSSSFRGLYTCEVSHMTDPALCAWCRDRELKRQEAEEEKKRKDMQRRENERKDKLLAEAKVRGFI